MNTTHLSSSLLGLSGLLFLLLLPAAGCSSAPGDDDDSAPGDDDDSAPGDDDDSAPGDDDDSAPGDDDDSAAGDDDDSAAPAEIAVESAQINCGPDPEPLPPEGVIAELAGPSAIQVMHFNFQMGCCPESEILASSDSAQSTITVTYNLWDDLCDCICDLDAMFTLTGIPAGSWTLELPGGVNREFVIE